MSHRFRDRPLQHITARQLKDGFVERREDGSVVRREYQVVKKFADGTYAVEAPSVKPVEKFRTTE